MKKQIKKLRLNKKTILNLTTAEMSKKIGGSLHHCPDDYTDRHCGWTKNQNTCPGHNTCYNC